MATSRTQPTVGLSDPTVLRSVESRLAQAAITANGKSTVSDGEAIFVGTTARVSASNVTLTTSANNQPADIVTVYSSQGTTYVSAIDQTVNQTVVNQTGVYAISAGNGISIISSSAGGTGTVTISTTVGNIAVINLDGNISNILHGDGSWGADANSSYGNSNVVSLLNSFGSNTITTTGNVSVGNIIGNGQALTGLTGANVSGAVGLATYAATANAVAGANVSGAVSYATTANAVAGANVSGEVTYAATANAVAGANVSGAVGLATYATTANAVAGGNVSGAVGLATYATTANAVAGANVSGEVTYAATANAVAGGNVSGAVGLATYATTANSVAVANVSGIGNIATVNLDGNVSNVLRGNGSWGADANSSYGDSNVVSLLGAFGSNTIVTTGNVTSGNLSTTGTITSNGGAYGEVVTTQFASVFATGSGPNPRSIMQTRGADGVAGIGIQAYSGINGQIYANTGITFTTGSTLRDKDYPTGGTTRATIDSTGLTVTGIANISGNITGGNISTSSVTASNIILPNSSVLTFGDTPVTNRYYVDATRTDTYTQNGSQARPFKTIAGAQAAIATAIIGGLNPEVEPIYMILLSNITENVTLATNHVYLIGQSGQIHQPIILSGNVTVQPTSGTLNNNHFSISGLEVNGGTNGKAIYVTGTYPTRLSLQDVWITAHGTGTGLYQDNTGTGTYTHGGPVKVSHDGTGDIYCFYIANGTASFESVETSGATQVGAVGPGAVLTFNNSQLDANGDVVIETYGAATLVTTNSVIKNSQANGFGVKLNAVANVAGTVSLGQTAMNVPVGTGQAVWLDPNTTPGLSGNLAYAGLSFYPGTNTTIAPLVIPVPIATLVGTIVSPILYGDITTYAVAQDWDLLDNNASALSFDTTGKAGIINIVTTNSSEGVTMSGYANVTGNVTGGNIISGGVVKTVATTFTLLGSATTAGVGARAYCTDANLVAVGNFGAVISGTAGNTVPVYSDGTNWCIG